MTPDIILAIQFYVGLVSLVANMVKIDKARKENPHKGTPHHVKVSINKSPVKHKDQNTNAIILIHILVSEIILGFTKKLSINKSAFTFSIKEK